MKMNQFESFNSHNKEKKFGSLTQRVLERLKNAGELAHKYRLLLAAIPAFMAMEGKAQEKMVVPIFYDDGVEAEIAKEGIRFDTISGAFYFKDPTNYSQEKRLTFDRDDKTNPTDSVVVSLNSKQVSQHQTSKLLFKVFNQHTTENIYVGDGAILDFVSENKEVAQPDGAKKPEIGKNKKVRVEVEGERVDKTKLRKKNVLEEIRKEQEQEKKQKAKKLKKEKKKLDKDIDLIY